MKINPKSPWDKEQIVEYLDKSTVPARISFCDGKGQPRICSLWYRFENDAIWLASHQNAYLIQQLKRNNQVAFEVSTNDYPYKGVRGTGKVGLSRQDADKVLGALIAKYLGNSNQKLSAWLMSRARDEYVIKIVPDTINAWDFSARMES